ncbi:MAG: lipooligosaccharide transport system ATP-binding protein [Blastocatellia bacterium]|jgi:lipooligosaccharide transport system ATP-binding protein|nr:lipooligosaccharide transport system ATP-binding protein [Blastocatellia bacterium]
MTENSRVTSLPPTPEPQTPTPSPVVVQANCLTKIYEQQSAVDEISFSVSRGETFGLLGPNGAGKSTTMRMIACRTPLTAGELFVEGRDVRTHAREIRSLIGVVPQENNLDPDLNVLRNLIIYASYYDIPKSRAAQRAAELLDFIGLTERADARIDHLSGGMKRRLMIARALLHEPRLLVLDEPTTGLDPQVRQEIWQKLEELRRVSGVTILLSTHYMEEAEKLCERLVVIDHGKILAAGTPSDLVLSRVSRFALEVRDVGDLPLRPTQNGISSVTRNNAHFYFAADADLLTPLMKEYEGRRRMIRLSNLEDVFLQLVSDNEPSLPA